MLLHRAKKLHFIFFFSLLMGTTLLGCAAENKPQSELRSDGGFSAPLPKSLNAANVTQNNLIVEIIIDPEKEPQDRRRLQNLVVDPNTKAFSGDIPGVIPAGPHTFRLVFTLNDPIFNEVEVAISGDLPVEVIANQDTAIDFSPAAMILTDSDGDSRTNLEELDRGWDPKLAAPAVPENVSATPGDQEVNLTWDAVDGAESYTIYWSDTGNATTEGIAIRNLTTTSFSHGVLANGITYSYIISALGTGGESLTSIRLNRIPNAEVLQPPSAPSGLIFIVAGDQEIELAWTPVPNVSYSIYRDTAPNVTTQDTRISGSANTPYLDSGLTNGTTYYYIITATGAGGESAPSVEVSDTPNPLSPAVPQGFTATPGDQAIVLTWGPVANANSYTIYWNTGDNVTTQNTFIPNILETTYTHRALTNGTSYAYLITAVGSGGESPSSQVIVVSPGFPENQNPLINITTPLNGAADVELDTTTTVSVVFRMAMDPSSIDTNTFILQSSAGAVSGNVVYGELPNFTATFTPLNRLTPETEYTAILLSSVSNTQGTTLPADFSWRFTTRDWAWQKPELIETNTLGDAFSPQIAVDPNGAAIAVWQVFEPPLDRVWANRYVPGAGWEGETLIISNNTENTRFPQVAVDSNGNAIAVWSQSDGTSWDNIWANYFVPGTGWLGPDLIELVAGGHADAPQVVFDSSGNATIVWAQAEGTGANIWSNRFVPGSGWSGAESISDNPGSPNFPSVAADSNGNAIAVWSETTADGVNIQANRFVAGAGWENSTQRVSDNGFLFGSATFPHVALDSLGNAFAIWIQNGGNGTNSKWFSPASGWFGGGKIDSGVGLGSSGESPRVSFGLDGNVFAVWEQWNGVITQIWVSQFIPGGGWSIPERIDVDGVDDIPEARQYSRPQLVVDLNGNVIVVWRQRDNASWNIWSNRFKPSLGWIGAELIESDDRGDVAFPQIGVTPKGNAIVVWPQSDGNQMSIWANYFE